IFMTNHDKKPNQEITKLIGQRIAILRANQNMSQTKLASKIGVSFQQVQKYESGLNRLSVDRLIAISKAGLSMFFRTLNLNRFHSFG
ncbi:MAG: helix-turn-helix transcriptional regulator, partial [Proteobacteria bacterium]|nr:helix-turn-helix transcriptional regulator [Pseudomonadota bacterium]